MVIRVLENDTINWATRRSLHLAENGNTKALVENLNGPSNLKRSVRFSVGNISATLNEIKLCSGVHRRIKYGILRTIIPGGIFFGTTSPSEMLSTGKPPHESFILFFFYVIKDRFCFLVDILFFFRRSIVLNNYNELIPQLRIMDIICRKKHFLLGQRGKRHHTSNGG